LASVSPAGVQIKGLPGDLEAPLFSGIRNQELGQDANDQFVELTIFEIVRRKKRKHGKA